MKTYSALYGHDLSQYGRADFEAPDDQTALEYARLIYNGKFTDDALLIHDLSWNNAHDDPHPLNARIINIREVEFEVGSSDKIKTERDTHHDIVIDESEHSLISVNKSVLTALRNLAEFAARMTKDGELTDPDDPDSAFEMENDDAVDSLHELISMARELVE